MSSTLSGGNTKAPPISVATSPTLPSLSKTNSVPVRAILSTMFCLAFRLKAMSVNKDFLSSQIRSSSEILDCFWWLVVCSEGWYMEPFNEWGEREYDDSVPGEVTKTDLSEERTT